MGSKSDYLENAWLAFELCGTAISGIPTAGSGNYYVGLFTVTPSDAGGGTETTYTSYARQPIQRTGASWTISGTSPTQAVNANQINFPTVGATAGAALNGWGIFDAISGGNLYRWGALSASQTPVTGNSPYIPAGGIQITED